jgi:hypothetical protein
LVQYVSLSLAHYENIEKKNKIKNKILFLVTLYVFVLFFFKFEKKKIKLSKTAQESVSGRAKKYPLAQTLVFIGALFESFREFFLKFKKKTKKNIKSNQK